MVAEVRKAQVSCAGGGGGIRRISLSNSEREEALRLHGTGKGIIAGSYGKRRKQTARNPASTTGEKRRGERAINLPYKVQRQREKREKRC